MRIRDLSSDVCSSDLDAERFCLDHGLSHGDSALVRWLVKRHLLMSLTAQKQDLSDDTVIAEFTRLVGSRQRLDYLYLLTCADIRGTNPALWNAWRASLLKELYHLTVRSFERGIDNPPQTEERGSEIRSKAASLIAVQGISQERVDAECTSSEDEQRFEERRVGTECISRGT